MTSTLRNSQEQSLQLGPDLVTILSAVRRQNNTGNG